jgi:hypothetical protein
MSLRAGGSTVAKFLGGLFSLNGTQFPVVLRSERTDIGALLVVVHVFGRYGAYKACAVVGIRMDIGQRGGAKDPYRSQQHRSDRQYREPLTQHFFTPSLTRSRTRQPRCAVQRHHGSKHEVVGAYPKWAIFVC